jgi:hypothetical protein
LRTSWIHQHAGGQPVFVSREAGHGVAVAPAVKAGRDGEGTLDAGGDHLALEFIRGGVREWAVLRGRIGEGVAIGVEGEEVVVGIDDHVVPLVITGSSKL